MKNTANQNRANLGVLFLNQSGKKVGICPFYMQSVKGMFQALFPTGYKKKGEGLITGYIAHNIERNEVALCVQSYHFFFILLQKVACDAVHSDSVVDSQYKFDCTQCCMMCSNLYVPISGNL